ncbi:Hypothetical protein NTJ_04030 [Nesidiocoris tenuis]|uniref:Uncharacterized protein n=1 Tax=Nesidiocoris tenuis TaxID=355587 RepID=A0ABN7ALI9_9HEMI|nr:Hypothetical protein NTJ_04030 [Nesidiocoris tenuis]
MARFFPWPLQVVIADLKLLIADLKLLIADLQLLIADLQLFTADSQLLHVVPDRATHRRSTGPLMAHVAAVHAVSTELVRIRFDAKRSPAIGRDENGVTDSEEERAALGTRPSVTAAAWAGAPRISEYPPPENSTGRRKKGIERRAGPQSRHV